MVLQFGKRVFMTSGSRVDPLVTHRFPLERAADAFSLIAALSDGVEEALI